ncbi:hypothetical protein AVEN_262024-1 [Araneus ventricosus]|uniref:Uncharacterized protein n=1 Tax=Araneus ventricosus TaxID=182803 RepID=A0A4Y2S959_ARAVE|nr:hypothetical protein AVEN_271173-1 [Araneus ventricosus]GBN83790.1 hypothetical protein AVEN_50781-1 [Araneus ventricosus]GBN84137.1 hypothetical protein AVEN_220143-1 [Araneus ventricosus]GBN84275.1 hypothetical protein AVEN_262024-1 [Araneus ventricosus]
MLGVDVLRAEDLRRVHVEDTSIPTSDDSVSNSDNDTNKSSSNSELNLNEGINNNSSQTDYIAKMKNNKCSFHGQKPYDQLSDREKQRLMERQSRRVLRLREEKRRYGINRSISIGKDDLAKLNDNGVVGLRRRENSTCSVGSLDSVDDLSSSFEEEEDLERNLEFWYQSGCVENHNANDRSNWDLVKNYMEMEDKIEELQKSLMQARLQGNATGRTFNVASEMEKIRVFREEIETLMRENDVLQAENEKLRLRLPSQTG